MHNKLQNAPLNMLIKKINGNMLNMKRKPEGDNLVVKTN